MTDIDFSIDIAIENLRKPKERICNLEEELKKAKQDSEIEKVESRAVHKKEREYRKLHKDAKKVLK